ncbi:MAG: DNA polymerase III subunit delta [Bacilli bacterium]|nr:DNA polymerase III subunit delta [Bacilli bacterium]
MNNLYFIESDNHIILDKYVREILNDNKIDEEELIRYDLDEVNISDVIMELNTYGLFTNKKIVFASNATFLTTDKSEINHDVDEFIKYINNPSDNILILSFRKLDGKKNVCKLVKEKFKIVDVNLNYQEYIKEKTKGYKFSTSDIIYFLSLVTEDIDRINNELDKLLMFKLEDKEITKKDIDLIVVKKIDDNIFDLIEAIIKKDKKKSLTIYNDIVSYGEEVFKILISLSNQIRLLLQVKILSNENDLDIADKLNLKNPKQLYFLRQKIMNYKKSELVDYLYKLSIMDEELKLGKSKEEIIFPVFIASL